MREIAQVFERLQVWLRLLYLWNEVRLKGGGYDGLGYGFLETRMRMTMTFSFGNEVHLALWSCEKSD